MYNLKNIIIEDLRAVKIDIDDNVTTLKFIKHIIYSLVFYPNFSCVFWYRINHLLEIKKKPFRKILHVWRFHKFSNDISPAAIIGPGLRLVHVTGIVIGSNARIGNYVTIFDSVTIGAKAIDNNILMPKIGDNVFIGTGTKLIGGIKIGDSVIFGAMTYCDKNIPSNSVVFGNPIKVLKNQKITNTPSWNFKWYK